MAMNFKLAIAVVCLAALLGCSTGNLQVAEVGSYHVGGRAVTLSGLPEKELVFTPVRTAQAQSQRRFRGRRALHALYAARKSQEQVSAVAVAWWWPFRSDLGDQAGRCTWLGELLSSGRL
jgi:hypothetical protein